MTRVLTEQPNTSDHQIVSPWQNYPTSTNILNSLASLTQLTKLSIYTNYAQTLSDMVHTPPIRFEVLNDHGQAIFHFWMDRERTFERCCCVSKQSFNYRILDANEQAVIRIDRNLNVNAGCCCALTDICQDEVRVTSPFDIPIGSIRQNVSCSRDHFSMIDEKGYTHLRFTGHINIVKDYCGCCFENRIPIFDANGYKEMGAIFDESRYSSGNWIFKRTISFPMDLSIQMKAIAIGALLLTIHAPMFTNICAICSKE